MGLPDSSWFIKKKQKDPVFERLFLDHFPMILRLCNPFGSGDGDSGVLGRAREVACNGCG